jgi:hypothetical protein
VSDHEEGCSKPNEALRLTRDELMKELSADPRCRIVQPSGKGFVIGGAKPPSEK